MLGTAKTRSLLLVCGILASLLYVCTDILAGMMWEGYSFFHQAVSELSAVGAPTRPFVVPLDFVYDVLTIAFGLGLWRYSQKRGLRLIGGLMMGIGILGFVGAPFPLQLGAAEATSTNTMHSIVAGVQGFLYLLAMGVGVFAWGRWFRLFSMGTILTLVVVAAVMGLMAGANISSRGFTTPPQWFGLIERIDIYGSMLWAGMLAIILLHTLSKPSTTLKLLPSGDIVHLLEDSSAQESERQ